MGLSHSACHQQRCHIDGRHATSEDGRFDDPLLLADATFAAPLSPTVVTIGASLLLVDVTICAPLFLADVIIKVSLLLADVIIEVSLLYILADVRRTANGSGAIQACRRPRPSGRRKT